VSQPGAADRAQTGDAVAELEDDLRADCGLGDQPVDLLGVDGDLELDRRGDQDGGGSRLEVHVAQARHDPVQVHAVPEHVGGDDPYVTELAQRRSHRSRGEGDVAQHELHRARSDVDLG
jgi:hypothetical protein